MAGFGPHLGESDVLHEVVIEFSRERAVYVSSREWHPTQQLQELPNGRLRPTFTCVDVAPVVSWIWNGARTRAVIAPESLVKRRFEEARAQCSAVAKSTGCTAEPQAGSDSLRCRLDSSFFLPRRR